MSASPSYPVIIVGGGLSGLSAAHTVLERGGNVLVIDKNSFLGGNSTKATSGVNGAGTQTQARLGIKDSVEAFVADTTKSARDRVRPELVEVLCGQSAAAVEWLQGAFQLDLSLVSRLGGHSFQRTHRGKERFPGMTITYALMERLEEVAKREPQRAAVLTKARVTSLLVEGGAVLGVQYEHNGRQHTARGPVVLATGGYGADFTDGSLLRQYRPDVAHLSTTNGAHCTGDGIRLASAAGAGLVDMEYVQVHPTGLVDPKEPDAKVKFLAAEALRGCGGILLDRHGRRFCNDLGHRDYVTGEMGKNDGPFHLVLNGAASKEIEWHVKHYCGRGLMQHFASGADLAREMGIPAEQLRASFDDYNRAAANKDDRFGKVFFHNTPFSMDDHFNVAVVTPVVHYTMGGLHVGPDSSVRRAGGEPIAGLFAAGEVMGGVHGANRLGGSSLLDCVVFGRVAGASASSLLLGRLASGGGGGIGSSSSSAAAAVATEHGADGAMLGATVNASGVTTRVSLSPDSKQLNLSVHWDEAAASPAAAPTAAAAGAASKDKAAAKPAPRGISSAEVALHNTEDDCWVIVNGQVLDVTDFLAEHPGGKKAIMLFAGRDATEEFNMLHKPDVVEKYAPESIIGHLDESAPIGSSGSSAAASAVPAPAVVTTRPSSTQSWESGGTADILPAERAKATFETKRLSEALFGGAKGLARRRFIQSPTEGMDLGPEMHNWSRNEKLMHHVRVFTAVHDPYVNKKRKNGPFHVTAMDVAWMSEVFMAKGSLMNSFGLYLPSLRMHASEEQWKLWGPRTQSFQMVGCYAQTELGHGSNVRGLQTTAEFDKERQEFVLNTPTLRSMKWWPGTLGCLATHALVYAQLIIDGKEHGVQAFNVQIRDHNHLPMPGVEVGDVGAKLGDEMNDTGFMRLKDVRVPRQFMLSRYQHVEPDGTYVVSDAKKQNAQLLYSTMMMTRGNMSYGAGGALAKAVTIAVRYAAVRVQGFKDTRRGQSFRSAERPIIDYQVQRYRLFRQLANAHAIMYVGTWMVKISATFHDGFQKENLGLLPMAAAMSAGLKAVCSIIAATGIEDLRKCCGGHGYLLNSGIAHIAADYVWQTTAEGDHVILQLLTSRFLLKGLSDVMSGQEPSELLSYLAPLREPGFDMHAAAPNPSSEAEFADGSVLNALLRHRALVTVSEAGQAFQTALTETGSMDEARTRTSLNLLDAVRAHTHAFMMERMLERARECADAPTAAVIARLAAMFALQVVLEENWAGILSYEHLRLARAACNSVMEQLRPDAVAIVDAFDYPDRVLNSCIGRADGNVYEALYEAAKTSALNQVVPFQGYQEYLRPYLDIEFLKLGNVVPPSANL